MALSLRHFALRTWREHVHSASQFHHCEPELVFIHRGKCYTPAVGSAIRSYLFPVHRSVCGGALRRTEIDLEKIAARLENDSDVLAH